MLVLVFCGGKGIKSHLPPANYAPAYDTFYSKVEYCSILKRFDNALFSLCSGVVGHALDVGVGDPQVQLRMRGELPVPTDLSL